MPDKRKQKTSRAALEEKLRSIENSYTSANQLISTLRSQLVKAEEQLKRTNAALDAILQRLMDRRRP